MSRYFSDASFSDGNRPLFAFAAYNASVSPVARRSGISGRLGVLAAVLLAAVTGAAGADAVVVEDWSRHAAGAHGVPDGWRKYETVGGHPAYDFEVVQDGGHKALRLRSHADHSTIAKDLAVDLAKTPVLEWTWKIRTLPTGGDVRKRATSDLTAHLFVVWPRVPALIRSRLIGYGWDATAPAGTIAQSQKAGTVTFVLLHSGSEGLDRWITERRNVVADYRRIYGEAPENPGALALSIDTNDTRSSAEGLIGSIRFVPDDGSAAAPRPAERR